MTMSELLTRPRSTASKGAAGTMGCARTPWQRLARTASRGLACIGTAGLLAACAQSGAPAVEAPPPPGGLYAMPGDLGLARSPDRVDPARAAELAEAALYLLNSERPGGPDYAGAARMCLLAVDAAVAGVEDDLRQSCYRVAARSALRSGDTALYVQAVDRWASDVSAVDRAAGEFVVHAAIRDRLEGRPSGAPLSDPLLRRLLGGSELPSEVSAR